MAGLLARFSLAGLANTAIGYAAILACLAAGMGDYAANACGYAVGIAVSYLLNRRFTFGIRRGVSGREVGLFLLAVAIAYSANLAVLGAARSLFGPGAIAQIPAIATYALVFFILSSRFVFVREDKA